MKVSWKNFFFGLLKNKVPQLFFKEKISRSFTYTLLNNSEQKFQKNICFKIIGSHHTLESTDI